MRFAKTYKFVETYLILFLHAQVKVERLLVAIKRQLDIPRISVLQSYVIVKLLSFTICSQRFSHLNKIYVIN